ncbi:MAG: manganese efflux pump MntP family protein [Candidatus Thermoplasmatota archaeon]|jgi:putative Mn2+ efflux pump MntP|nr:manganese efflux pump MntP family protein [Candidatus Thermoplasmatota archaeon]
MLFLSLAALSLSLAMDAFAASITCGITGKGSKEQLALKVGLLFGGFQAGMTALGFLLGSAFRGIVGAVDHFIAFLLLLIIGGKMVIDAARDWNRGKDCKPLSHAALLSLSVATSIDAFAVGITLSLLHEDLLLSASMIGAVALILSFIGVLIGDRVKGTFARYAEVAGGIVLIGLGIKILIEHTML